MNIRWDKVADLDLAESSAPRPLPCAPTPSPDSPILVKVRLFGALAALARQGTLSLELSAGATIGDVLAVIGRRLGAAVLVHVLDDSGAKRRYCRIFLGGYAVDDLRTPLGNASGTADIDIILLIAPEGG